MTVEIGKVTAHPLKFAFSQFRSVIKTWMFARKHGLPANEWYGVYESGSDNFIAQTGCLPQAKHYASLLADAENDFRKHNTANR